MDFNDFAEDIDENLLQLLFEDDFKENIPDFPSVELDFNIIPQIHEPQNSSTNGSASATASCINVQSQRFKPVSSEDVEQFLENNQNKNTKRKTVGDTSLFKSFLEGKGDTRNLEIIPPDQLNVLLCELLLSVTKKDGTQYEPTTQRGIIGSIGRYLRLHNYKWSIITSVEFGKPREVLKTKQKLLKKMGKGNKLKAADPIDDELIESFYQCGTLGDSNPSALIHSMWMIFTVDFGMRTGQETYNLRWGDIQLKKDILGEYLIYDTERQTKTRTGLNERDTRLSKPRAYAIPDEQKDPVHLYKMYASKRPVEMLEPESPFFLSVANKSPNNDLIAWYKKQAMGINKMYSIMKEMKMDADVKTDKRITPYSVRKHMIQKLSDSGIPSHHIMQISGHKNVNSLNNYSELNAIQSKEISDILSSNNRSDDTRIVPASNKQTNSHVPTQTQNQGYQPQLSHLPGSQMSMLAYRTFNSPVTFNFDNTSSKTMNTAVSKSQYHTHPQTHSLSPDCSPQPRIWKRLRRISSSSKSE